MKSICAGGYALKYYRLKCYYLNVSVNLYAPKISDRPAAKLKERAEALSLFRVLDIDHNVFEAGKVNS